MSPRDMLTCMVAIADEAGKIVLEHYAEGTEVRTKADASPVTAADEAAETLILAGLDRLAPKIPVVAEERVSQGDIPDLADGRFFLVDPLDGTKEFLTRNGEFTVNIALIEGDRPRMGVVLAPARGLAWWGLVGEGAHRQEGDEVRPIGVRPRPEGGLVAIASRSHRDAATEAFLERAGVSETISAGSSLKFCLVAEGRADVYPRFGPTMEWDTAAGQAVLEAAGGRVTTPDGAPFRYQKPDFRNGPFVAWGG
jgi:3'(2'), 5'-bisphosphate nucleotidase